MADRNTTQKDKDNGKVIEQGLPRCKKCYSRLSVVEMTGEVEGQKRLWCFNCDSPFLNRK